MSSTTSSATTTAMVLLGHGSRDPLWQGPIQSLAARIRLASPAMVVQTAFLEWATPDLTTSVESLMADGHRSIRLLPLFFGMGKHAREDLPQLVNELRARHPDLQLEVMNSAGEQDRVLDLLAQLALKG
ncbi:MAG: cobalamin biosynthesis protein CbiX [Limnohabitans sp.]|nr:cobalamin biosynthesis protein CbiX [Limnohabitans sp.]